MGLTSAEHPAASAIYIDLKRRGEKALAAGNFVKALKYLEWALVEARRLDRPTLEERAYCNVALLAQECRPDTLYSSGLKKIVETSVDVTSRFLAAHALTLIHNTQGQAEVANAYAYASHGHACQLETPHERTASSYTLGVQLLIDGDLQRSQRYLEQTLELGTGILSSETIALARSTLGYCLQRLGQPKNAYGLLRKSLDHVAAGSRKGYENIVRLNLGFSLLEMDGFEGALDQATAVLDARNNAAQRKNALFLAGEACTYLDSLDWSREYFSLLQQEFYPRQPEMLDTLQSVRTHRYVNWFA